MHERHDEAGGANGIALREAQRNYARYGAKSERAVKYARKPKPEDKRDPNWKPLD
jgi:Cysteine-rich CPCC